MEEKRRNFMIVSIKVDKTPWTKCPFDCIFEVSPNPKENVRSVILKTKESKIRQPITKFCLLIPCDWTDYGYVPHWQNENDHDWDSKNRGNARRAPSIAKCIFYTLRFDNSLSYATREI